jgi:hypothetical protein
MIKLSKIIKSHLTKINKVLNIKKSTLFITFHKTASSLFGHEILCKFKNLQHFDPQKKIYEDINFLPELYNFEMKGWIYGPIRLSSSQSNPQDKQLFSKIEYLIPDYKAIFLVRDPRDIIVSAYYSFLNSHSLSSNPNICNEQISNSNSMKSQSIDEYAINVSKTFLECFNYMFFLLEKNKYNIILKYEELILYPNNFIDKLNNFCELDNDAKNIIIHSTRPNETIKLSSHKRSGKIRQFESELKQETQEKLYKTFHGILKKLDYIS